MSGCGGVLGHGAEGAGHSGDRGAGSRGWSHPGDRHMGSHPLPEVQGSEWPGCLRCPVLAAGGGLCPSAFFSGYPSSEFFSAGFSLFSVRSGEVVFSRVLVRLPRRQRPTHARGHALLPRPGLFLLRLGRVCFFSRIHLIVSDSASQDVSGVGFPSKFSHPS